MSVKAGTAYIDIQGDFSSLNKQIDSALSPIGGKFGKVGKAAAVGLAGVGVAAAGATKALYDIGASFDDAYDTIRVSTGATGKQLDRLKGDFKDVVRSVPTDFGSASRAVGGLNQRLGLTGKPLRDMSKQILELSRITKTDLDGNIKAVTRTFGDWGIKVRQQGPALDQMFRASQKTGVGVAELGTQMVKFGAPLRQMGFGFAETAALLGKFEKEGVNTELVMGSLRIALGRMAKEGIRDPSKALEEITRRIKLAGSAGEANALALETFGARAGPDMAAAIREGRFEIGDLEKTIASGRDTIIGASKDTQDFSEKWQLFKNRVLVFLEPLAIRVFDAIGRGMDQLGPIATRLVGWFEQIKTAFQGTGEQSAQLSRAVETARGVFEDLRRTVTGVVEIASAAWQRFGGIITQYALGAAETIRGFVTAVVSLIRGLVDVVAGILTGDWARAWSGIKGILDGVLGGMSAALGGFINQITTIIETGLTSLEVLWSGTWNAISRLTSTVWAGIRAGLVAVWNAIRQTADSAWGGIRNAITAPVRAASTTIHSILEALGAWMRERWDLIRGAAAAGWSGFRNVVIDPIRDAIEWIHDKLGADGLGGWLRDRWSAMTAAAGSFANGIKEKIEGAFKGAANAVIGFVNAIINAINKIPGVPDIGQVPKLAQGGKLSEFGVETDFFARGGVVRRPMAIVGEEAPRHPEYVIPTNPAYRGRALGLFQQLGMELMGGNRLAMFAQGGVFGNHRDRMGGLPNPLDLAKTIAGLPLKALERGADFFLDLLPDPTKFLPEWLRGLGKYAIDKVTGWIKDKVSSILPFGGDGTGPLGGASGGMAAVIALASQFGNVITSGYRPGDPGWHGQNRARDFAGGNMAAFAQAVAAAFGSRLLELIHSPLGWGIKNGQRVPIGFFGADVVADHFDHVHVAMARGGLLSRNGAITGPFVGSYRMGGVVPRDGLAQVHAGETITPAGGVPVVKVIVQDGAVDPRKIETIVERATRRDARFARPLPGRAGALA